MSADPIRQRFALGPQWPTLDPFLFVAHHLDHYPAGNDRLGPAAPLDGRRIGMDFDGVDGWNMYHGSTIPGFPQHPHRGFETITHLRTGHVDHADSLGATARFGPGDTQWMTAGSGIVHAEMFPLLVEGGPNPLELFQIWLNLPADDKMVDPSFTMLWDEETPRWRPEGSGASEVVVLAGRWTTPDGATVEAPSPPPDSAAADDRREIAVWHVEVGPGEGLSLPPVTHDDTRRVLYAYRGGLTAGIGDRPPVVIDEGTGAELAADRPVDLAPTGNDSRCLVLQGRPLGEPVVQYGPFVMNSREQIVQAMTDYQATGFGGWPWPADDPVHDRRAGRFARHADGRVEHR